MKETTDSKKEKRPVFEIDEVGSITVVHFLVPKLIEDLDIQRCGAELFDLVEDQNRKKLLLDFSAVDFIASAFLGKLVTLDKKTKARGGTLRLCGLSPQLYEAFEIIRLHRLILIVNHRDEAIDTF